MKVLIADEAQERQDTTEQKPYTPPKELGSRFALKRNGEITMLEWREHALAARVRRRASGAWDVDTWFDGTHRNYITASSHDEITAFLAGEKREASEERSNHLRVVGWLWEVAE